MSLPATPLQQRLKAWHCRGLGCSDFARRYWRNRICFIFLRVLRCFNSPRVALWPYEFRPEFSVLQQRGLPHSDISGSRVVCTSPELFAAYHVLHRHQAPNYPPMALSSLTWITLEDAHLRAFVQRTNSRSAIVYYFMASNCQRTYYSQIQTSVSTVKLIWNLNGKYKTDYFEMNIFK